MLTRLALKKRKLRKKQPRKRPPKKSKLKLPMHRRRIVDVKLLALQTPVLKCCQQDLLLIQLLHRMLWRLTHRHPLLPRLLLPATSPNPPLMATHPSCSSFCDTLGRDTTRSRPMNPLPLRRYECTFCWVEFSLIRFCSCWCVCVCVCMYVCMCVCVCR